MCSTAVSLDVRRGEMVAIVGASGAGKSTLLHILGALDRPSAGQVTLDGESLSALRDEQLSALRNRKVGFVFQFHHLLREFSALENVMMPLRIAGWDTHKARASGRGDAGARRIECEEHASAVGELSGGEQQRTAVARALAIDPVVVLADEPSGNLDHANAERLHEQFTQLVRDLDIAMVVVTHNRALAARADRVLLAGGWAATGNRCAGGACLMLCDSCKERDAVVQVTQVTDPPVRQLNLCEKCAAERGIETHVTMPKQPLTDFIQAVQQKQLLAGRREVALHLLQGSTLRDFRNTSGSGARTATAAFEANLRDLLRDVHGNFEAPGQALPSACAGRRRRGRRVATELRDRLRRAIEQEQFEEAAKLRDQLKVME